MRTLPGQITRLDMPSRWAQKVYGAVSELALVASRRRYNLTISHEKRFVWFRVSKVATRTIFHHLAESGLVLDAEHPSQIFFPHNIYRDYFKFAFVRNPWERLVSTWRNKVVDQNGFDLEPATRAELSEFPRFVDHVAGLDLETCDEHMRLQCRKIDLGHIDYLGRFETFNDDLAAIFNILDLPLSDAIVRKNVSSHGGAFRSYYDDALVERVGQLYRRDIQIFGYRYDS